MKILNFADGVRAGSPLKIRMDSKQTEADIIIYAGIGTDYWGDGTMISAKDFSDQLKALPSTVNKLNVRINSGGGDVFDGITIYNRLKQFKGAKTVYIDGLAASIASIIALAGDEIIIGEGAMYMVHLPWTWAMGDRQSLDNTINRLMDVEEQMLGIYAKKSGMDKNEIRSMLEAETWLGADDTVAMGFADKKVEETAAIAASAMNSRWIKKAPKAFLSDTQVTKGKIDDLKKKLDARLARK